MLPSLAAHITHLASGQGLHHHWLQERSLVPYCTGAMMGTAQQGSMSNCLATSGAVILSNLVRRQHNQVTYECRRLQAIIWNGLCPELKYIF